MTAAHPTAPRLVLVDALRGFAIVMMVIYHFCFDLSFFGLADWDFYNDAFWNNFRTLIVSSFLFLVGVSLVLATEKGFNARRYWRRLGLLVASAAVVSVGSWLMFAERYIFFGILHFIAVASVIGLLFVRTGVVSLLVGVGLIVTANSVQLPWFDQPAWQWFGLMTFKPPTEDYVPLLPWLGVVLLGVYAGPYVAQLLQRPTGISNTQLTRGLAYGGRHSLLIYLLHQPVLIGALWLVTALPATAQNQQIYGGLQPPLNIVEDNSVVLTAPDADQADGRSLPLSIVFPQQGGPYPLIVLSHGTFSSPERYQLISRHWAGQGYVVMVPQHKDANYAVRPTSYETMQAVTMSRVADMSQILDELQRIEQRLPALAGKIDHAHYIAAGHSIGTQVAMLVTGMQYRTGFDATAVAADENRYQALVLVSDPGKMRLMPLNLWLGSTVPTYMATGTDDYGLMGSRGPATEAQSELLTSDATVDRYMLLVENSDHYFGGLIQKDVEAEPDHQGLALFNATSTAFLDAYIKESPAAKNWLQQVDLPQLTDQRAQLIRELSRP